MRHARCTLRLKNEPYTTTVHTKNAPRLLQAPRAPHHEMARLLRRTMWGVLVMPFRKVIIIIVIIIIISI